VRVVMPRELLITPPSQVVVLPNMLLGKYFKCAACGGVDVVERFAQLTCPGRCGYACCVRPGGRVRAGRDRPGDGDRFTVPRRVLIVWPQAISRRAHVLC
jgi:hypothetical protein